MTDDLTYRPPEGVHGPTLGALLPDGVERVGATCDPASWRDDDWLTGGLVTRNALYWWRWPALKPGDRVTLTGTMKETLSGRWAVVAVDGDHRDSERAFPCDALRRLTDQDGDR